MKHSLIFICVLMLQYGVAQELSYTALDSFINISYNKGDYPNLLLYTQKGIEKAKADKNQPALGFYLQRQGLYYEKTSNYALAEQLFKQAIEVHNKKIDKFYLQDIASLGNTYILQNKNAEAEKILKEGILLCKKNLGEENDTYASLLNILASLYKALGNLEETESLYKQILQLRKRLNGTQHKEYAAALNNLAAAYYVQNKCEEAEPLYKQALEINRAILGEKHPEYATSLNNLAILYSRQNKYAQAEPLLKQALQIYKQLLGEKNLFYTSFLNNLAGVYQYQNKDDAEVLYKQCLELRKEVLGEQHPKYAATLNNLALFYQLRKKYDLAEPLFKKALEIRKKNLGENTPSYAISLNDLGSFYHLQGKYTEAKAMFEKALPIFKQGYGGIDEYYIQTLTNLGKLHYDIKEYKIATDYYSKAILTLCKNCDSSSVDWDNLSQYDFHSVQYVLTALDGLSNIKQTQYKDSGDLNLLTDSYKNLKTAIQINEKMRQSLNDEEDKLQTLRQTTDKVKNAIKIGFELSKNGDGIYLEEAFSHAEQNKSILLADAVKGQRARVLGDLPDSLILYEIRLQTQKKNLEKAEAEAKTEEAIHLINKQQSDLSLQIEAFLKSIQNKYPKYHALKYGSINAKVQDIQKLLEEQSLLLEYFIADSVVYLFAISKKQMRLYPIEIKQEQLKKEIQKLRDALSNYSNISTNPKIAYRNYIESAHWFYKTLLAITLEGFKFDNLVIVADGELGHLPFETFLVEPAPQADNYKVLHYLINDYNISYNYSATLWKENKTAPQPSNNHQILACAAHYQPMDSTLGTVREPYLLDLRKHLQPLPAAVEEINALSRNFEGSFLANEAVNEGFFKKNAKNYGIIHLAMHGILHPRIPILSSLAFTENRDSLEDNFLQAYEIAHLQLNADLVVLSACETGYGKFEQGEGVISLARSFMYAGVPSLVVSLWQVNDLSTSIIMGFFYKYLSAGMTKDAALRQAKLDYIKNAEGLAVHPAFWSAFIQLGDNRPITVATPSNILLIAGSISLIAILGGGILFWRRKKITT